MVWSLTVMLVTRYTTRGKTLRNEKRRRKELLVAGGETSNTECQAAPPQLNSTLRRNTTPRSQTQRQEAKHKHSATKPNTTKPGQETERLSTRAWAVTSTTCQILPQSSSNSPSMAL